MNNPPATRTHDSLRLRRTIIAGVVISLIVFVAAHAYRFVLTDELNQSVRVGELERAALMLRWGARISGSGMHGMTPLMTACEAGRLESARWLIERGADVNGHNSSGSALMWAIEADDPALVELLLKNGVDTAWRNHAGKDAMEFARDRPRPEMVALLEDK